MPQICNATSKHTGVQCKMGRSKCRFHGGRSPRGTAHWNYQGKGRSKDLPLRLADRVRAGLLDPELMSLRKDVAREEAFVQEKWERLAGEPSAELAKKLLKTWERVAKIRERGEDEDLVEALNEHHEQMRRVGEWQDTYRLMTEIGGHTKTKAKLVKAEASRAVALGMMLTVEQQVLQVGLLQQILAEQIADKRVLARIGKEIETRILSFGRPDDVIDGVGRSSEWEEDVIE